MPSITKASKPNTAFVPFMSTNAFAIITLWWDEGRSAFPTSQPPGSGVPSLHHSHSPFLVLWNCAVHFTVDVFIKSNHHRGCVLL